MPLSTSSSDGSRWLISWAIALIVAAVALFAVERYWRARGYYANVQDSAQLWSLERERIYSNKRTPLILLGASRIEFSIDLKRMKALLPDYQISMLATNGRYPLAVLHDLSDDERFNGVVLCDIDSRGLTKVFRDMMQDYVHYYHTQWTPSWRVHRRLLTLWQRAAVIASPDFSVVATLKNWLAGGEPFHAYHHFFVDRSGDIDFSRTDIAVLIRHFEDDLEKGVTQSLTTPDQWIGDLSETQSWVARIQARGGQVIFYETPVSGALRKIEETTFPKSTFWDKFSSSTSARTLHYSEIPALAETRLPDQSHLDFHDKAAYTDALVSALVGREYLRKE